MNSLVKKYARDHYPDAKGDLFACFIKRGFTLAKDVGHKAMVTMQSWMFLSSFKKMRELILRKKTITTMAHMANGVMGIAFGTTSNAVFPEFFGRSRYVSSYSHTSLAISMKSVNLGIPCFHNNSFKQVAPNDDFKKIPGSPVAYWVSKRVRQVFEEGTFLGELVDPKVGLQTGDNSQFLRLWHEVDQRKCSYHSKSRDAAAQSAKKWFPYNKGGEFRKWYGNQEYLVNWEHDGRAIRAFGTEKGGRARSAVRNTEFYFSPSVTWSFVSSSFFWSQIFSMLALSSMLEGSLRVSIRV